METISKSLSASAASVSTGGLTDTPAALPADATAASVIALLKAIANKQFTIDGDIGNIDMNTDDLEGIGLGDVISTLVPRIDSTTTTDVTYIGEAVLGSATSGALWRIQTIDDTTSETVVKWADGDQLFNNIWDNRASLSYSS